MSSVHHLREFISQRLTAAAEEIFRVFERNIVELEEEVARQSKLLDLVWKPEVKLHRIELPQFIDERLTAAAEEIFGVFERNIIEYEDEVARQNELLDIVWKPEVKLHRIELPQHLVCEEEEEVPTDQERNSSRDQEEPEPLQIKEEQEETCISQEGEQLVLKQETDAFMLTPDCEDGDHREPEPDVDHQLLSHDSPAAESQDQEGREHEASGSKRLYENLGHSNIVNNSPPSNVGSNTHTEERSVKCDICGKALKYKYGLKRHMRTHTGEKPYLCKTCGKGFVQSSALECHIRTHTGEKPYLCTTCGKGFSELAVMKKHLRTHTGERPFTCNICGKGFARGSVLKKHIRTHTGEKPYPCNICGRSFVQKSTLIDHKRIHTGEKPYPCSICGRSFVQKSNLTIHKRIHTSEKLYSCNTVGKDSAGHQT